MRFQDYIGLGSTDTRIPYFTNETNIHDGGIFEYVNDSTNGLRITILRNCFIYGSMSAQSNSSAIFAGFSLNASSPSTDLNALSGSEILCIDYARGANPLEHASASFKIKAVAGDIIRPHTSTSTTNQLDEWSVNIHAQATTEHVITPAKSANHYYRIEQAQTSLTNTANEIEYNLGTATIVDNFVGALHIKIPLFE